MTKVIPTETALNKVNKGSSLAVPANAISLELENRKISDDYQQQLLREFNPFFEKAREWAEKAKELEVTSGTQVDKIRAARECRLALKGIRVEVEKRRKSLKDQYLQTGKAIDAVARVIKKHIEPTEKYLQKQEDFVKIEEQNRHHERFALLYPYSKHYEITHRNLGKLGQYEFDKMLEEAKAVFEQEEERLRLEQEQQEALARKQAAEAKRIREEHQRLQEEARRAEEEALREKQRAAEEQQKKLEVQRKLEAARREKDLLAQELREREDNRLQELQEQLQREQALKEREQALQEAEKRVEKNTAKQAVQHVSQKLSEENWSDDTVDLIEKATFASDREQLEHVLSILKSVKAIDLKDRAALALWKRTELQLNATIRGLERGIKALK